MGLGLSPCGFGVSLVGDLMTELGLLFILCVLVSEFCHDRGILMAKAISSKMW